MTSITHHLTRISEALPAIADQNSIPDARYAAMVAAYRAAEHLYDLAEAIAEGSPDDAPELALAGKGAAARIGELVQHHGLLPLPLRGDA